MVTEDFLGLDEDDRKCQYEEPLNNCTTRQYLDTMREKCGCLPFNINLFLKVHLSFKNVTSLKSLSLWKLLDWSALAYIALLDLAEPYLILLGFT